jgi:hypothetical protein
MISAAGIVGNGATNGRSSGLFKSSLQGTATVFEFDIATSERVAAGAAARARAADARCSVAGARRLAAAHKRQDEQV